MKKSRTMWLLPVALLVLAGCGGASRHSDAAGEITAPAYNGYPGITIPVTTGTEAQCRHEARAFSREAVAFLAPFPSDSDTHLVIARVQFYEFEAHRCDIAILRKAFSESATPKQRRTIVDRIEFTFLGDTGRELTGA
jgi:RNase P protein component